MSGAVCIGYGELEGACDRAPDRELNPSGLWCARCEHDRRETITRQLHEIRDSLRPPSSERSGDA